MADMTLKSVTTGVRKLPTRLFTYASEKWGKCLAKGTPVLMYDGTVRAVEEVRDGDSLMGPDSRPRRVHGLHAGFGELFTVRQSRGDDYTVNAAHILSLKPDGKDGCAGQLTRNVPIRDFLAMTPGAQFHLRGWKTGVDWPARALPIPPYLFGCWLGDGTRGEPEITTPEPEVVEAMEEYAGAVGLAVKQRAVAGKARTLAMAGRRGARANPFTTTLRQIGVTTSKHIPLTYRTASRSQRLELLAGIIDTDGYLDARRYELTLSDEQMARDVVYLARSLGFGASIRLCEKCCGNAPQPHRGVYWRIRISGALIAIPTRVRRRRDLKPRQFAKDVTTCRVSVEPAGVGAFYGFEVDADGLFMLGDFTVTHNTSFAAYAPAPIFLMTRGETGLEELIKSGRVPETPHFPRPAETWADLMAAVNALITQEHAFKTFITDTANGAERLCFEAVCQENYNGDWTAFDAYGRGYVASQGLWVEYLDALDRLRERRKMAVVMLAHSRVKNFKNPTGADYDKFEPEMHKTIWSLTHKWADIIAFGAFNVKEIKTQDRNKVKAIGGQERVLHLERSAAWDAGNRYGLPASIACTGGAQGAWTAFAKALSAKSSPAKAPDTATTPAPMPNGQPQNGAAPPPAGPSPGTLFVAEMKAEDARLAEVGHCNPGDFLDELDRAVSAANLPADWATFTDAHITVARGLAKRLTQDLEQSAGV